MSQPDFDSIGEGVIDELHRRLGDPSLARDLPGTLLMKFAETYLKTVERRQELEAAKQEQEKIDPLVMIDQEGMGLEQRITILTEYLGEVQDVFDTGTQRLIELLEEYQNEHPELLQDVQDVVSEDGTVPDVRPGAGEERGPADGGAELAPLPDSGESGDEPQAGSGDGEAGEAGA